jgi:hypothetical protein
MRLGSGVESYRHGTAGGDDTGRDGEFAIQRSPGGFVSYEFVFCRDIVVKGTLHVSAGFAFR